MVKRWRVITLLKHGDKLEMHASSVLLKSHKRTTTTI